METHVIVGSSLYVIKKEVYDKLYQKYNKDMNKLRNSSFVLCDSVHNKFLDSIVKKSISKLNIENIYDYV